MDVCTTLSNVLCQACIALHNLSGVPAFARERVRAKGLPEVLESMRWKFPNNALLQQLAVATIASIKLGSESSRHARRQRHSVEHMLIY